jgi:hypothetical protein
MGSKYLVHSTSKDARSWRASLPLRRRLLSEECRPFALDEFVLVFRRCLRTSATRSCLHLRLNRKGASS